MRLPTIKQLDKAGDSAHKLLDAYRDYWTAVKGRRQMTIAQLMESAVATKRLEAGERRRAEYFGYVENWTSD